jgi:DNA-binding FadR family transcriptional regulator
MELNTRIDKNVPVFKLVIDKITNAILNGELKAGDKLPTEQQLVESLGAGRYSVREAVKMLVALGILEIRRADGTYIVDTPGPQMVDPVVYSFLLSQKTSSDLQDMRAFYERTLLELAVARASVEDIEMIESIYEQFEKEISIESKYQEIIDLDMKFHKAIAKAAKSSFIERMYEAFFKVYIPALERLEKPAYIHSVRTYHKQIISILKDRDQDIYNIKKVIVGSLGVWSEKT